MAVKRTYPQLPAIRDNPTKESLRLVWDMLHSHTDFLNNLDERHISLLARFETNQTTLDRTVKTVTNIAASQGTDEPAEVPTLGTPGQGPSSPPPPNPPPPGGGTCSTQQLSSQLPSWFSSALISAGQNPGTNCYDPNLLAAIESTCNANDYTLQRDSGCNVRGRLYHQSNHGLWGTFCGQADASAVADFHIDVVVTNADSTVSWGWV